MKNRQQSGRVHRCSILAAALVLWWSFPGQATADFLFTYVTGETATADVIFRVVFDPAVAGSAVPTPILSDTIRMDGIDFVGTSKTHVVVGAQRKGGGAITHYNVSTLTKLPSFITDTNTVVPTPPPSGSSRPSTVLSTATHTYYTENQFGFEGGTNRIMKTAHAGPAGTASVVFDGAATGALGLINFEGLEIIGSTLYFFAQDHSDATKRALYSIGLDGSGVWDTVAPIQLLGGLTKGAGGDGSDELDYDAFTGKLYGSNIISGEVIYYDPVMMAGGYLISPAGIATPMSPNLARMGTALLDGIRSTGTGFLVLTGIDGVILSIDLAGVAAGLDNSDVHILYDDKVAGNGYRFDDLTPVAPVPEPGTLALFVVGSLGLVGYRWRRQRRMS